jgi:TRAP-type uncharacterized transport system substrate-binding protein
MPPGLPRRPPLAAKLWLSRRARRDDDTDPAGQRSGRSMGGPLETVVRSRVRMVMRHAWVVTVLGTILIAGGITAGVYYSTKATVMRVAAGPADGANAKIVAILAKIVAQSHDRLELKLIPTDGAAASSQALADNKADLAIVPTTVGKSPNWPVVAILRQNVMALIVPAPPPQPEAAPPAPAPSAPAAAPAPPPSVPAAAAPPSAPAAAPPKTPESTKPAKPTKTAKPTKPGKTAKTTGKTTKTTAKEPAKESAKEPDTDDTDDTDDTSAKEKDKVKEKETDKDSPKDVPKLKVKELAGKRIGIVAGNEATPDLLEIVLRHYGVPLDKVQVSQIAPQDLAEAVSKFEVDVIFVAGTATGQAISDAVAAATRNGVAPTFIEIDQAEGFAKRNAAFDSVEINAGTFGGNPPTPDDKLTTLSFPEYLVARKGFSRSGIAELAKQIYTSRLSIAAQMPGEIKIEAPSTDKDADALVHPGALDYLNDDQKTFFDRYGDDIFYGLLIFPIFGSAIAGLAGFLRSDSRTRRLRHLQRVLDLVRKAHAAQTLEAIEHLQVEADHLVIAIIHLSEHEEFDESMRMSFSFALDQLRFTIAARRAAIIDHGGAATGAGAATAAATDPDGEAAAA